MKFAKIAAVSAIAMASASGAFAFEVDAKTSITNAFADISSAYGLVNGTDEDRHALAGKAADLLYAVDNVGAVESVTWDINQDPASSKFGEVNVEVDTFTAIELDVDGKKAAFTNQIEADFYGSDALSIADASVGVNADSGKWETQGITGLVGTYLTNTVVAESNDLNDVVADAALAGYDSSSLADIDSAVDALNTASGMWSTAIDETNTALGASASAAGATGLRDNTEGRVSITDGATEIDAKAHVGSANTFTYDSAVESTYRSVVDSYISNAAPAE